MIAMYQAIQNLMAELNKLLITYNYMVQNAPTEGAARMMELNRNTVLCTREALQGMYKNVFGKELAEVEEAIEGVPVFTDFRNAAGFAVQEEIMVIQSLKNLYLRTDACNHNQYFNALIEHQINVMRLFALLTC